MVSWYIDHYTGTTFNTVTSTHNCVHYIATLNYDNLSFCALVCTVGNTIANSSTSFLSQLIAGKYPFPLFRNWNQKLHTRQKFLPTNPCRDWVWLPTISTMGGMILYYWAVSTDYSQGEKLQGGTYIQLAIHKGEGGTINLFTLATMNITFYQWFQLLNLIQQLWRLPRCHHLNLCTLIKYCNCLYCLLCVYSCL